LNTPNEAKRLTQTIHEQMEYFSMATGIPCCSIPQDETGYRARQNCRFCQTVCELAGQSVACQRTLRYAAYQAERFGGKYIFYCPMGLVHFASPVYTDGAIVALAIGGPVLLIDREEYLSEDVMQKYRLDEAHKERLRAEMSHIPELSPERVTALSEMLFSVCAFISGAAQLQYIGDEETVGRDMEKYLDYINTMGSDNAAPSYPIEKERELLALIALGEKEESIRILDEILRHIINSSNKDFERVKARILELVVLLSRAALEGGADLEQIFGLNYKFLDQINHYQTVEGLASWLSGIMVRFTDCVFTIKNVKHMDTIYKAVDYIKRHYREKITLEDVAKAVYLSPAYFSKVFKEGMSVSFSQYLNQVRIENSKRYLMNKELDMIQIAEMLGFEDQSYFSKVFKKITGVTPSRYRQRHRG